MIIWEGPLASFRANLILQIKQLRPKNVEEFVISPAWVALL